jgi:hypothetical protein
MLLKLIYSEAWFCSSGSFRNSFLLFIPKFCSSNVREALSTRRRMHRRLRASVWIDGGLEKRYRTSTCRAKKGAAVLACQNAIVLRYKSREAGPAHRSVVCGSRVGTPRHAACRRKAMFPETAPVPWRSQRTCSSHSKANSSRSFASRPDSMPATLRA